MNRFTLINTAKSRSACNALHAARYPRADYTQIVLNQAAMAARKTTPTRSSLQSRHLLAPWGPKTDVSMPAKHQHVSHAQVETT